MLTMVRPIFSVVLSLQHNNLYHHQRAHSTIILKSMSNGGPSESTSTPKRIFCYGDSLTAGTAPPLDGLFPYGQSLESELGDDFVVRWRGLPGWTADTMVEHLDDGNGLRAAVNGIGNPPLSLVIILAGTNDIGFLTYSIEAGGEPDVDTAVTPILNLHKACLDVKKGEHKIRTLAVGIPGSLWQEMKPSASKLAADINSSIQQFALSSEGLVSYTDFPFPYEKNDLWCSDGLHLSPNGYTRLGRDLAPIVKQILERCK